MTGKFIKTQVFPSIENLAGLVRTLTLKSFFKIGGFGIILGPSELI